jgi:hypothetical protein
MAPLSQKAVAPVQDTKVHAFLVPWRRAHRKQAQTWKEQRTPDWQLVTCELCLQHRPANDQKGGKPGPGKAR